MTAMELPEIKKFSDVKVGDSLFIISSDPRDFHRRENMTVVKVTKSKISIENKHGKVFQFLECEKSDSNYCIGSFNGVYSLNLVYTSEEGYILEAQWKHLVANLRYAEIDAQLKSKVISLVGSHLEFPENATERLADKN